MGCGPGGCSSPCFPASRETNGDLASTVSFCLMGMEAPCPSCACPYAGLDGGCRSLGCALCPPCWAPSTPLNQRGPCSTPLLSGQCIPGFPSSRQGKRCPCPSQFKKKKAVFTECKHGHTGEGYRKQINRNTEQTNNTFIHLRLLQRFAFVL